MNNNGIRGIVFDMDGVIIDSHPAHRRAWREFLQSMGRECSESDLDFVLDGHKREEILRHFLGDLAPEQICEYGNHKDEVLRRLGNDVQPVVGVMDFMSSLKRAGIRAALATSAGRRRTYGSLSVLGLGSYFDAIVTGDEVVIGKPDPMIYHLAAERLQEDPHYLIAVEDAVAGVKAATVAGMRCIGVAPTQRAEELRAAGATPVIPDFQSLSLEQLHAHYR